MNKRAQFSQFNIFTFMIVAFLTVVFFAGLIYVQGLLKNTFDEVGLANEVNSGNPMYVNMSLASEQIWGQAYNSILALRMVSIVYILCLGFSIIIVGFLEKKHPFLFFVYILIAVLAVIFAPTISNAYETLLGSGIYAGELNNFNASNFILLNLPTIVLVISIIGGILMMINLIRVGGEDTNL